MIFTIIYFEMLSLGILYSLDPRDSDEYGDFTWRDLTYVLISFILTFGFSLIAYGLFLDEQQGSCRCRHYLAYFLLSCVTLTTMLFVLIYTFQLQDEDKVLLWATAFALAMLFECLINESLRLALRALLICVQKDPTTEEIELPPQRKKVVREVKLWSFADEN